MPGIVNNFCRNPDPEKVQLHAPTSTLMRENHFAKYATNGKMDMYFALKGKANFNPKYDVIDPDEPIGSWTAKFVIPQAKVTRVIIIAANDVSMDDLKNATVWIGENHTFNTM